MLFYYLIELYYVISCYFMLYYIILYYIILYYIRYVVLYHIIYYIRYIILYHTIFYCIISNCLLLYYIILYYAILCYILFYYAILSTSINCKVRQGPPARACVFIFMFNLLHVNYEPWFWLETSIASDFQNGGCIRMFFFFCEVCWNGGVLQHSRLGRFFGCRGWDSKDGRETWQEFVGVSKNRGITKMDGL